MKTCSINGCSQDGCQKESFCKGMCEYHYIKLRRTFRRKCSVDGCEKPGIGRGLCQKHYNDNRYESVIKGDWSPHVVPVCGIPGCGGDHLADGMCQKHYTAEIKRKNREFIMERYFKSGVICEKCGRTFNLVQMDFHHPDQNKKELSLSVVLNNSALIQRPLILTELDTCKKLCARCHQNTHYNPEMSHESTYDKSNRKKGIQVDRRKEMVRKVVGENCIYCGDWLYPKEMEFHHKDRSDKFGNLSDMFRMSSKDAILREVAKCDMVCRNCHRLITEENRDTIAA